MRIRALRRAAQAATLCLIIAIPLLNRKGITFLAGSLYSLAIGAVWITDPLSGILAVLSAFAADVRLLVSLLIPVAAALVLGRVFCGWICPQNTFSELFDFLSERMSSSGKGFRLFHPSLSAKPRYAVLILVAAATLLLGFPAAGLISAPGIISVQSTKLIREGSLGAEAGLIGMIIILEIFLIRRFWCNFVCPVGGFLGLLRLPRTMRVVYREDAEHPCGKCYECADACRLGLDPVGGDIYPLCHNCGDCIAACEGVAGNRKPLSFRI